MVWLLQSVYVELGSFFGKTRNLDLFDGERDLKGIVTWNKSATSKAVSEVFSRARNCVGVEGSDAAEAIAERNAAQAFLFSRY
jgi:hypothetical protein